MKHTITLTDEQLNAVSVTLRLSQYELEHRELPALKKIAELKNPDGSPRYEQAEGSYQRNFRQNEVLKEVLGILNGAARS